MQGTSLARIDLGPLQTVGIIHVDRFPRSVKIKRSSAPFAMPVAGLLDPAERQMHFSPNRRRVDVGDAGLQVAHRLQRQVYVAGIERSGKPILDSIRDGNRLVETV